MLAPWRQQQQQRRLWRRLRRQQSKGLVDEGAVLEVRAAAVVLALGRFFWGVLGVCLVFCRVLE
jgi:hypothetical protein